MKAWHFIVLFLALLAIAVVPLFFASPVVWSDFMTNVSTELIGAAVTVGLVGFIVSRIQGQRIKDDQKEVERSLGELAFEFVNHVFDQLEFQELPGGPDHLESKTNIGLAEYAIGIAPDEVASTILSLSDSKLVLLANYIASVERRWQAFYNRHSDELAQESGAEMIRLSTAIDVAGSNVLALSQVEAELDSSFRGDPNNELDVFSHRSNIHEVKSLRSSLLAYDLPGLLTACVRLAIQTEYIESLLWTVHKLDNLLEETLQQSEEAYEEFRN